MLLQFQRQNLIATSSSSDEASDDGKFEVLNLFSNKNAFVRLSMFGKIKKMIKSFEGKKLLDLDKNLMKGVFQRKLQDFDEDQYENLKFKSLLERLKDNGFD